MQQILQNLRNGAIELMEVPCRGAAPGHLLVKTQATLISSGTERMLLDFGKANWIEKARSQPDKVWMVLDKARTDGIAATFTSVRAKLDQPVTLGYSNVGIVLETAAESQFLPGDRVVSNGNHAEIVHVPKNLCARIPNRVSDESAAFTVVGAVALEGIRLAQPTLGEYVVVTGLGLIGLLTVQLLRANGCRVLGIDLDPWKLQLAEHFGAETVNLSAGEDPVSVAERFSHGRGVDAVLITASTQSNDPVHQAALMCRKRGRIVLVGVAGLQLSRDDFYKKELSFQVSCSYGPGRYDAAFENGQDYPYGYVRWTAQRNFEAVLDMLAESRLDVEPLITHRFAFDQAEDAYALIQSKESHLGVLLIYAREHEERSLRLFAPTIKLIQDQNRSVDTPVVAFIGAGGYATKVLIPAFQSSGANLATIVSSGGVSAAYAGRKFGFCSASTDVDSVFSDASINTLVIATRHDSHAGYVREAILAGKNVFVEKPLALSAEQIDAIERDYLDATRNGMNPFLMVGFNRRFAPQVIKMKSLLAPLDEPKTIVVTVNAGRIRDDHWTQDKQVGGGRIIGEVCHFVDLLRFLTGVSIASIQAVRPHGRPGISDDTLTFSICFVDGSVGTVHYVASGHKSFPKERIQVFCGGRVLELDNYRKLSGWGWKNFRSMKLWRQDKGATNMVSAFVDAIRQGRPSPIPIDELLEISRTTIQLANL